MSTERKLVTISIPPALLREAERAAERESRTKSEFFREALRFYLETAKQRLKSSRERLFSIIEQVQEKTRNTPPRRVRKMVHEAIAAARRTG